MWTDVAAAIGGGLGGLNNAYRYEREQLNKEKVNEIRAELGHLRNMVEVIREDRRDKRNTENITSREKIAGNRETGLNDRFWGSEERKGNEFFSTLDERAAENERRDTRYWDQSDRGWSGLFMGDETRRRGQDVTSSTARRGQDITSSTARRGQDMLSDRTNDGRAMSYAIRGYNAELARRKASRSLFSTEAEAIPTFEEWVQSSDDPEIFPSVQARFGGKRPAVRPDQGLSPEDANPDTVMPAPMPSTRTPPPALPATGPAAAPPAAAPKPPPPLEPRQGSADPSLVEQQMAYLMNRIRSEEAKTGQRNGELRAELARLRALIVPPTPAAVK